MTRLTCAVFLWLTSFLVGCVQPADVTFAARNDITELKLDSLVRGQANALLSMTQDLETQAKRGFNAPRKLSQTLEDSIAQMDQIQMNLPALLADQDVEIAELRQAVSKKTAQNSELKMRYEAMQNYRNGLLKSLDASAARTALTLRALQGSGGASAYVQDAKTLSRDLDAARSMIQLQM